MNKCIYQQSTGMDGSILGNTRYFPIRRADERFRMHKPSGTAGSEYAETL